MAWFSVLTNRYVVGGVIIVVLGIALWVQSARLNAEHNARVAAEQIARQWQTNFEAAEQTNRENAVALEKLKSENARINAIVADSVEKYNRLGKAYETLKRKAYTDETAVSPDWCSLLDELRRIQGGTGPACLSQN